jgi:VanZ family protein
MARRLLQGKTKGGSTISSIQMPSSKRVFQITEPACLRRWLRALWFFAILIVSIGSLLPDDSAPIKALSELPFSDKMEHFVAYAFLAFLPAIHERLRWIAVAAVAVIALGIGLEFCQLYSGWRAFEIADVIADTFGVCVGLAIGVPIQPVIRSNLLAAASRGTSPLNSGNDQTKLSPQRPDSNC